MQWIGCNVLTLTIWESQETGEQMLHDERIFNFIQMVGFVFVWFGLFGLFMLVSCNLCIFG